MAAPDSIRSRWRAYPGTTTATALAVAAFLVYNLNLRSISSADTFPTRYLPISILTEGDLDLDEFEFLFVSRYLRSGGEQDGVPYYLQRRRGHYVSTFPVVPAILATPVYAVPVLLGWTAGPPIGELTRTEVVGTALSKIASSAAIAVTVALTYLSLLRLATRRVAFWGAFLYAFATSAWAVSSQGLWQSSASQPLLAGAFLSLLRARERDSRRDLALAGALAALAVACRPPALLFAAGLALYVASRHRRRLATFLAAPVVVAVLLLAHNLYYFDSPLGGYAEFDRVYFESAAAFARGLAGLLVSPNRGILVYSPVLLAAFAGGALVLRRRDDLLRVGLAAATLATIGFYASYSTWYGHFSFGDRFLVETLPAMALLTAEPLAWIGARRWRRTAFATLVAYSVFVQVVGAFFYPCGWYRSPMRDPSLVARFFAWGDLEVAQCLAAGPVEPDGLKALRALRAGP